MDENAYFKQVCYRFNDKIYEYKKNEEKNRWERKKDSIVKKVTYSFAFYAELDITDEELLKYNTNNLVSLGGDNSQFIIEIRPDEPEKNNTQGNCVVLESPAFLYPDELQEVRFAITDTIPFKCMKTKTETVQTYNIGRHRYDYSEGLNLYDRGSVFYLRDEEKAKEFTTKLESHADFYQIGYNHYRIK